MIDAIESGIVKIPRVPVIGGVPRTKGHLSPDIMPRIHNRKSGATLQKGKTVHEKYEYDSSFKEIALKHPLYVPLPDVADLRSKDDRYLLLEVERLRNTGYTWNEYVRWLGQSVASIQEQDVSARILIVDNASDVRLPALRGVLASLPAAQMSAQIPVALDMPGAAVVARVHAEGAQIYECGLDANQKLAWKLRVVLANRQEQASRYACSVARLSAIGVLSAGFKTLPVWL